MDSRHRAPFAHQSSSVDLHSQYTQQQSSHAAPLRPTQWAPPSGAKHLGVPGVVGGPGFFEPPPAPAPNKLASAAAGLLSSFKMQRKASDDGDYALGTGSSTANRSSAAWDADSLQRALPSAQTVKFVLLCFLWYATSAVSSNTGKVILNNFKFPVTLVIVQFAFVAGLCWIGSRRELGLTGRLRSPTKAILRGTLPMAVFQVGGHIFGSLAISRVPVSTVHTIKALSPLFTVLAYAIVFGVSYSPATYISILPLTLGVMLAVSFDISLSNFFGLVCAFGSTIVFVSQNIFFKKVMPSPGSNAETSSGPRLDKINLLYFSSGMAFLLMIPIWLYSDAGRIANMWFNSVPLTGSIGGSKVALYLFINGTVHFAQNVLAFLILSSTSPVTYSIASLVKRIAVICLAIIWFKQSVHAIQAVGIALTAVGLYMYNNAKRDVEKGEKKMRHVDAVHSGMLPTSVADQRLLEGRATPTTEKPYAHLGKESPRPSYSHDFESVSKSSAIRSAAPPPIFTMPPPRGAKVSLQEPYPSPPASTASSPPLPAVPLARGDDTPSISLNGA